jgi:hypothetical protein
MLRTLLCVLAIGCFSPDELHKQPGQDEAMLIIRERYADVGLALQDDLFVFWHLRGGCLADLPVGSSTPEGGCRAGRAAPILGVACILEVSWMNRNVIWLPAKRISDTSLAHELMHCAFQPFGDTAHQSFHWRTTLPATVSLLRQVGL